MDVTQSSSVLKLRVYKVHPVIFFDKLVYLVKSEGIQEYTLTKASNHNKILLLLLLFVIPCRNHKDYNAQV